MRPPTPPSSQRWTHCSTTETRWSGRSQPGEAEPQVGGRGALPIALCPGPRPRRICCWEGHQPVAPCNWTSAGHFVAPKGLPICLPWYPELGCTLRSKQKLTTFSLSSKKLKSKSEDRPDAHATMREKYKGIYSFASNGPK